MLVINIDTSTGFQSLLRMAQANTMFVQMGIVRRFLLSFILLNTQEEEKSYWDKLVLFALKANSPFVTAMGC